MKKDKGITLVALIITIIVLLILAGVTISLMIGNNGIINHAKNAGTTYKEASVREKLQLKILNLQTNILENEKRTAVLEDLEGFVLEDSKNFDIEIQNVQIGITTAKVKIDGYIFEVDNKLNIIGISDGTSKTIFDFSYTGDAQEFLVPLSGVYEIECWGAGDIYEETTAKGAYTYGKIRLQKGQKLYIYVGESGSSAFSKDPIINNYYTFNGGGRSYLYNTHWRVGGGNGATDIRLTSGIYSDFDSLKSRIMVAGGAGSCNPYGDNPNNVGGEGGMLVGGTGKTNTSSSYTLGKGGTQISGGIGNVKGKFGIGASGVPTKSTDNAGSGGGRILWRRIWISF